MISAKQQLSGVLELARLGDWRPDLIAERILECVREETRLTLEKLGMPSALLEALTVHMRDELAPKPRDRGTHIDIGDPAPWDADDGPRIQRAIDLAASKVKPTQAKCEECGGPPCRAGCESGKDPRDCKECGNRTYGFEPAPAHKPTCSRRPYAQPSPTTEAPETTPKEAWIESGSKWQDWGLRAVGKTEAPGFSRFLSYEEVEKRVAEAKKIGAAQGAAESFTGLKADYETALAKIGETQVSVENAETRFRHAVACAEQRASLMLAQQETIATLTASEQAALARVRELEAELVTERTAVSNLTRQLETAERELGEARAEIARYKEVQAFVSSLRDKLRALDEPAQKK